jgi:hypothetical protein
MHNEILVTRPDLMPVLDAQPGRLPAVAKYRAPDSEVRQRVAAE